MVKELQISDRDKALITTADGLKIEVGRNHEERDSPEDFGWIGFRRGHSREADSLTIEEVTQLRDGLSAVLDDFVTPEPTLREKLDAFDTGAVIEVSSPWGDAKPVTMEKRADGTWFIKAKDKAVNAEVRANTKGYYSDMSQALTESVYSVAGAIKHLGYVKPVPVTTYELDFVPA